MKKIIHCLLFFSFLLLWEANVIQAQTGLLSLCDDLSMNSTSSYEAEVSDLTGAGTGHDQVSVSGDLTLNGTLNILLSGYVAVATDAFEIMSYDGTLTGTFSTINWPADMLSQGWLIDYGVLTPGKITIYGPSIVLPVELLFFSVSLEDGINVLTWETESELNNDFFAVEYSTNGKDFYLLEKVSGKGNSSESHQYRFPHKPDQSGDHYYRLQQVDFDGQFEYSYIVSIFNGVEKTVSFYPNPTSGTITFNENQSSLLIYNLMGQQVLSIDESRTSYDLSALPSGTFFIKSKEVPTWTERLVISK